MRGEPRDNIKKMNVEMQTELYRWIKVRAAQTGKTMREVLEEIVRNEMERIESTTDR